MAEDIVNPDRPGESLSGEPLTANPFCCNLCKKSYTRIDHLARHFRSHSRERPYACQSCGKTFARIDLLKRHEANHIHESTKAAETIEVGPQPKRRKAAPNPHRPRAVQACRMCAESKLRCDGNFPCMRCQQKSVACEFPEPRLAGSVVSEPPNSNTLVVQRDTGPSPHVSNPSLDSGDNNRPIERSQNFFAVGDLASASQQPPNVPHFEQPQSLVVWSSKDKVPLSSSATPALSAPMVTFEGLPDLDGFDAYDGLHDILGDDSFPRDVLDFGVDLAFDTPSIFHTDFELPTGLSVYQAENEPTEEAISANRSGFVTPGLRENLNIKASVQAFKESLWLWTPEIGDRAALEQRNLSLPWDNMSAGSEFHSDFPLLHQGVSNVTRGKILAMVLGTCETSIHPHVISNFPGADLLTTLIHNFIGFHSQQDMMWIHPASIDLNKDHPLFLMGMIASGAVTSHIQEIRKLGFAMQEALREALPPEFERDNRATRDLRVLQSFTLSLDVALWSGDRRKMEIAESFAMPMLTMVRRAGHYRFKRPIELPPKLEDNGEILESKWRSWIRQESFKRLALYLFYRDTRSSISLLSQPLISYAEVSTSLPCHKSLWLAKTSTEWKQAYLAQIRDGDNALPSIRSCMDDSARIFERQGIVDVDMSLLLIVAAVWPLIWQFREMKSVAKFRTSLDSRHSVSTMNARQHEVSQMLQHINLSSAEWLGRINTAAWLLQEQCLMHIHASLEDIQLLAGREGEDEARRVFPTLTAWVESAEARQALVHAGQIIRAAREYQRPMLRDAAAVAVYHASLIFWAYAVLSRKHNVEPTLSSAKIAGSPKSSSHLRLDDENGPEIQRFVTFGKGSPCIGQLVEAQGSKVFKEVPIKDAAKVMETVIKLLQMQHEGEEQGCPPLLANLSKLMQSLGKAAVGKRHR